MFAHQQQYVYCCSRIIYNLCLNNHRVTFWVYASPLWTSDNVHWKPKYIPSLFLGMRFRPVFLSVVKHAQGAKHSSCNISQFYGYINPSNISAGLQLYFLETDMVCQWFLASIHINILIMLISILIIASSYCEVNQGATPKYFTLFINTIF